MRFLEYRSVGAASVAVVKFPVGKGVQVKSIHISCLPGDVTDVLESIGLGPKPVDVGDTLSIVQCDRAHFIKKFLDAVNSCFISVGELSMDYDLYRQKIVSEDGYYYVMIKNDGTAADQFLIELITEK